MKMCLVLHFIHISSMVFSTHLFFMVSFIPFISFWWFHPLCQSFQWFCPLHRFVFSGFIHYINHHGSTHILVSNGLVHYACLVFLVVLSTMLNLGGLCFDGLIHPFHVCCLVQCSFWAVLVEMWFKRFGWFRHDHIFL